MTEITLKNVNLIYKIYGTRNIKNLLLSKILPINDKNSNIQEIQALYDINLNFKSGDRVGIMGFNGSGKTTLLKVISKIYEPTSGLLSTNGTIASLFNATPGIDMDDTGYETIKLCTKFYDNKVDKLEEIINYVEEFTELGEYLKLPIRTYSTGMQTRLAFAIATCANPNILVLDEIIGAGDVRFIKKVKEKLNKLIYSANICIVSSHSEDIIKEYCNKAILMNYGKVLLIDSVENIISEYKNLNN